MISDMYPYPVMSSDSESYIENKIVWSEPAVYVEEGMVCIDIQTDIGDDIIAQYVNDKKAELCALVYCPSTNFRKLFSLEERIQIKEGELSGTFYIEPSVTALTIIEEYSNPGLSEDYDGMIINIPKGGFLALGDSFESSVSREEVPDADSICKFEVSGDGSEFYDCNGDYITIYISEESHKDLNALDKNCKIIFTSVHVPAVIADVIQRFWKDDEGGADGYLWHNILEQVIENNYPDGCYKDASAYAIMMTVIGQLISRGSSNIYTVYKSSEEEYQ